jgi:hypothetical protein
MWLCQPEVAPGWRLDLAPPCGRVTYWVCPIQRVRTWAPTRRTFMASSGRVNRSRRSALCACRPDLARFGDIEHGLVGANSAAGGQGRRCGGAGVRPVARRRRGSSDRQPQRRSGAVAGPVVAAGVVRRQPGDRARTRWPGVDQPGGRRGLGGCRHAHDRARRRPLAHLRCVAVPERPSVAFVMAGRTCPVCGCSADRRCRAG